MNVTKLLAIILPLVLPIISGCGVLGHDGCFTHHLDEAIALNHKRAPFYSQHSQGRSEAISEALIEAEEQARPYSRQVDYQARAHQKEGRGVVCDDFVSMKLVPPAKSRFDSPAHRLSDFKAFDTQSFAKRTRRAYKTDGFEGVRVIANLTIEDLENLPNFHCMVRHTIESMDRIAWLAPTHIEGTNDQGTRSKLRTLSWKMIKAHLVGLPTSARLDQLAAPVQSEGIPILCNDVPPIHRDPV